MSTIVILSDSSEIAAVLGGAFPQSEGHDLVSIDSALDGSLPATLRRIHDHDADAVVIDPGLRVADGIAMAEAIENDQPELSLVLIAEPTPQILSQAMRVGVREVVPPLSISKELGPAVARAADLVQRRRAAVVSDAGESNECRVIVVISPKGGAGKTVVSTNLAVGLARQHPGKVVLIDADLQFGDVDTAMRIQPETTIVDAVRAGISNVTELKLHLEAHPTGLFVLAAPARPGEADEIGSADLGKVIELLSEEFEYLVIDTDGGIGERTLTVLEHATDHVFICATDVPSVRGLTKALEALDLIGITAAKRHFVLNRADARVGLDNEDIAITVGVDFDVRLPSCREVTFSVNEGVPILSTDEVTPITRPLQQLVERFSKASDASPNRRGRFGRKG